MTDIDLRTRAREAAEEEYDIHPGPGPGGFNHVNAELQHYKRAAFVRGALWHAAQQPSREQIARAIAESQNPGVPGAFDAQRGAWLTDADAVLVLFDGADR